MRWLRAAAKNAAYGALFRLGAAFEDQSFGGREALIKQGKHVAQVFGVTEARSEAGAQRG